MRKVYKHAKAIFSSLILLSSTFAASYASPLEDRIKASEDNYTRLVEEMKRKAEQKCKVVYAVREIKEGEIMNAKDFEERELECSKVPQDAITSAALCVGRVSKYGIYDGSIVSQHDVAPHYNYHLVRVILSDAQNKRLSATAAQAKKKPNDLVKSWVEAKLGK